MTAKDSRVLNPHLFSASARRYLSMSFVQRDGIPIFPKRRLDDMRSNRVSDNFFLSTDEVWLRFIAELGDRLTESFPRKEDASGGVDPQYGITGNFQRIRTIGGYTPTLFSCPQTDSVAARRDAGVRSAPKYGVDNVFTQIVDLVVDYACSDPTPVPIRYKVRSHPGLPGTQANREAFKRAFLTKAFSGRNHEYFVEASCGSLSARKDLYHLIGACPVGIILHRGQADSVNDSGTESKQRPLLSPEVARGARHWKGEYYDKRVIIRGQIREGYFAQRVRNVVAPCFTLNALGQAVDGQIRTNLLNRLSYAFHHRGIDDVRSKSERWTESVSIDAAQWDALSPIELYDGILDSMGRYLDERYVRFCKMMLRLQIVMHQPGQRADESFNPVFGHPAVFDDSNPSRWNFGFLPSGDFFTSSLGKIGGSAAILYGFHLAGITSDISELKKILEGRSNIASFLNMTDDNHVGFFSPDALKHKQMYVSKLSDNPFAKFEVDSNNSFGGLLINTFAGKTTVQPRINGFIENTFWRERSYAQKTPENIARGMQARRVVYSSAAQYQEVVRVMDQVMIKHLGVSYDTLADSLHPDPMSAADQLFLDDPNVIQWKIDPSDVSIELLDTQFISLQPSDFCPAIAWVFRDFSVRSRYAGT